MFIGNYKFFRLIKKFQIFSCNFSAFGAQKTLWFFFLISEINPKVSDFCRKFLTFQAQKSPKFFLKISEFNLKIL